MKKEMILNRQKMFSSLFQQSEYLIATFIGLNISEKNMIWALIVLVKSRFSSAKERLTELFAYCLQDAILLRYP